MNEVTPHPEGWTLTRLGAVLGGLVTPMVVGNAMKLLHLHGQGGAPLVVAFVPLLLLGCFLGFRLRVHRYLVRRAGLAVYLSLADKISAPLPSHLGGMNQLVIIPRNGFSGPLSILWT